MRTRAGWLWVAILLLCTGIAARCGQLVYVGTYTGKGNEGISVYRFDPVSGDVRPLGLAARTDNPSFLVADGEGRYLFAVNELDSFQRRPTGAVSAFAIDAVTGHLDPLQQISSLGGGPAHLSLDRSGRFLLVANYGGGSVAVFPVGNDGRLGRHTAFMQAHGSSLDPKRQAGPHAHCVQVTTDNRLAVVADLGIDRVLVYDFDPKHGTLQADSTRFLAMEGGAGPRHVAMAPDGRSMYVVNEISSTVTTWTYEPDRRTFGRRQTLSTLPPDFTGTNTTAEILVDRQGRYVYITNRGDDSIVVFGIDSRNGSLTPLQRIPSGGKSPRHIALDPTGRWLWSANARSNSLTLFLVDPDSGRLTTTDRTISVVTPVCVTFVEVP